MSAKRAVIYARTSSDDSVRDSMSSQIAECEQYCESKNYTVVDTLRESAKGQSGADINAPALQEAIRRAEAGLFDVLIVRDISRFTRSAGKGAAVKFMLSQAGVHTEFVWNNFDGEYADLLEFMATWASEQERSDSTKRMRVGKKNKISQGSFITHGPPPYGYTSEKIDGLFRAAVVETEAEIVRYIYHLYVEDRLSIRGIAKRLNDKRFRTRKGKWWPQAVYRILTDPIYRGEYHYGVYKVVENKTWEDGTVKTTRTVTLHDPDHHTIIEVPAIIDKPTWDKARKRLAENAADPGRKPKYKYLMSRRVRCGSCNRAARGEPRDQGKRLYYGCNSKHTENCVKYIRADKVDKAVWDWLEGILKDQNLLREKIETLWDQHRAAIEPIKTQLRNIDLLIEQKKAEYDKLIDLYLKSNEVGQRMILDRKQALETEIESLETERLAVADKLDDLNSFYGGEIETNYFTEITKHLDNLFGGYLPDDTSKLTFEEKREKVERFNVKATITQENGEVWLNITSDLGEVMQQLSQISRTS